MVRSALTITDLKETTMTSLTKRVSLAAASAVLLSLTAAPAFAADLDLPPPPPPLPELRASVTDWTGLYVGGQIGVACFETTYYDTDPATADPLNFGGCTGMGGVYGGYNYQLGSSFVVGLEGEYNASFDGHIWYQAPPSDVNYYVDDLSTIRARLGWLANDNTMLFVTGGYGWLGHSIDALVGPAPGEFISSSAVSGGYVVGGGIEHAITNNFHVKAEYLYGDFGSHTYNLTGTTGCVATCELTVDNEMHAFRVGGSYNFNFGGGYTTAAVSKW
jgi:outer membrane immunogenic protein